MKLNVVLLCITFLLVSCAVSIQPLQKCDKHTSGDILVDKVFRDCQK